MEEDKTSMKYVEEHMDRVMCVLDYIRGFGWTDNQIKEVIRELYLKFGIYEMQHNYHIAVMR